MAARKTPSRGPKPDKIMRDALLAELHGEVADPIRERRLIRRYRLLVRALVDRAIAGDTQAAKEIIDRVDGKPTASSSSGEHGFSLEDIPSS